MDMIIICVHIGEYLKIFNNIEKYINKNTIVTDVGSAKEAIFRKIKPVNRTTKTKPVALKKISLLVFLIFSYLQVLGL